MINYNILLEKFMPRLLFLWAYAWRVVILEVFLLFTFFSNIIDKIFRYSASCTGNPNDWWCLIWQHDVVLLKLMDIVVNTFVFSFLIYYLATRIKYKFISVTSLSKNLYVNILIKYGIYTALKTIIDYKLVSIFSPFESNYFIYYLKYLWGAILFGLFCTPYFGLKFQKKL